jgi:DNA-binding response OmpR family regulator
MPHAGDTRKILVVDDEPKITDTLALIFASQGYDVRAAYNAEDAIEIIAEWRPDLAVLDVVLPGMNGIDFAIVLKANHPGCRSILFSAQPIASELSEVAASRGHVFEILAKPMHPAVILAKAADLLAVTPEEVAEAPAPRMSEPLE